MTDQERKEIELLLEELDQGITSVGIQIGVLLDEIRGYKKTVEELLEWEKGFREDLPSQKIEPADTPSYADQAADYWGGQEP